MRPAPRRRRLLRPSRPTPARHELPVSPRRRHRRTTPRRHHPLDPAPSSGVLRPRQGPLGSQRRRVVPHHSPARHRHRAPPERPCRPRRCPRAPAPAVVLVSLPPRRPRRLHRKPHRPHPHRPPSVPSRHLIPLRLRLLPKVRRRLLHRLAASRRSRSRTRSLPRRLHLPRRR
jgi:hypothetical protein